MPTDTPTQENTKTPPVSPRKPSLKSMNEAVELLNKGLVGINWIYSLYHIASLPSILPMEFWLGKTYTYGISKFLTLYPSFLATDSYYTYITDQSERVLEEEEDGEPEKNRKCLLELCRQTSMLFLNVLFVSVAKDILKKNPSSTAYAKGRITGSMFFMLTFFGFSKMPENMEWVINTVRSI